MTCKIYGFGIMTHLVTLLILCAAVSHGLRCHKCLSINCADGEEDCSEIRSILEEELQEIYYFDKYLPSCPPPHDTAAWSLLKVHDDPCKEESSNEATCTLGRVQIQSADIDPVGNLTHIRFNFATIFGCAKQDLLRRTRAEFYDTGQCYMIEHNETSENVRRKVEIEHCKLDTWQCFDQDYCLDTRLSVVKVWRDLYQERHYSFFWVLGAMVVVLALLSLLFWWGLKRPPPEESNPATPTTTDAAEDNSSSSTSIDTTTTTGSSTITSATVGAHNRDACRMMAQFWEEVDLEMNGHCESSPPSYYASTTSSEPESLDLTKPPTVLQRIARLKLAGLDQLEMGEFTSMEIGGVLFDRGNLPDK